MSGEYKKGVSAKTHTHVVQFSLFKSFYDRNGTINSSVYHEIIQNTEYLFEKKFNLRMIGATEYHFLHYLWLQ